MRAKLLAGLVGVIVFSSVPSIALAEDATTKREPRPADPGIAAMRDAIETYRHDLEVLRAECARRPKTDACATKYRELLENFRAARQEALELHRAIVERRSSGSRKVRHQRHEAAMSPACLRLKRQLRDGTLDPNVIVRDAWRKACEPTTGGRSSPHRKSATGLLSSH